MRISYKHNFVFLANPRCGSSSVRQSLNSYSDVRGGGRNSGAALTHHSSLRAVQDYLESQGRNLDDFKVLTTCRNPWDRAVSIYHYGLKNPDSNAWHKAATEAGSFKAFCFGKALPHHFAPDARHRHGPYDVVSFGSDKSGKMRAEVFDLTDMAGLQARFGELGAEVKIPHVNGTERGEYRQYYDDETREHIARLFAPDITFMGYRY